MIDNAGARPAALSRTMRRRAAGTAAMHPKYKATLIRVEFMGGGPIDGKWVTIADWQERFILPSPVVKGIMHYYQRGESYEGNCVRTVFRYCYATRL